MRVVSGVDLVRLQEGSPAGPAVYHSGAGGAPRGDGPSASASGSSALEGSSAQAWPLWVTLSSGLQLGCDLLVRTHTSPHHDCVSTASLPATTTLPPPRLHSWRCALPSVPCVSTGLLCNPSPGLGAAQVSATGVVPCTDTLDSTVARDEEGALLVDEHMATSGVCVYLCVFVGLHSPPFCLSRCVERDCTVRTCRRWSVRQ